jgi:hypothetical protein
MLHHQAVLLVDLEETLFGFRGQLVQLGQEGPCMGCRLGSISRPPG